jgi:hypothetical protein
LWRTGCTEPVESILSNGNACVRCFTRHGLKNAVALVRRQANAKEVQATMPYVAIVSAAR